MRKSLTFLDKKKSQAGVAAMTSLLIISAVVLSVAASAAILSITGAQNALSAKKGRETQYIAQSCLEESLYQLSLDETYTGGTLSVGAGSCTMSVSTTGANRSITVVADLPGPPDYQRTVVATARVTSASVTLLDWSVQP